MTAKQRKLRRQQLDRQISGSALGQLPPTPEGGWIQAIREALGMTLDSFGERLRMTRQNVHQLEQAEAAESITLRRLRTAAEALDCELIILLRPKKPLDESLRDRALAAARAQVLRAGHSMAMEQQAVTDAHLNDLIEQTADEMIERGDSRIWQ